MRIDIDAVMMMLPAFSREAAIAYCEETVCVYRNVGAKTGADDCPRRIKVSAEKQPEGLTAAGTATADAPAVGVYWSAIPFASFGAENQPSPMTKPC